MKVSESHRDMKSVNVKKNSYKMSHEKAIIFMHVQYMEEDQTGRNYVV